MRHLRIFESHTEQLQEATPPTSATAKKESMKSIQAKRLANFFNKLYKINLPLDGNEMNKEYMKAFSRFCQEYKITTYTCKKGDGYCNDAHAGELTIRDEKSRAIFNKVIKTKALELLMKP